jgi:hypothetical protein
MTRLPAPAIVSIAHRRRGQKAFSARELFFGPLAAIVRRISFSAWAENVTEKVVPAPKLAPKSVDKKSPSATAL